MPGSFAGLSIETDLLARWFNRGDCNAVGGRSRCASFADACAAVAQRGYNPHVDVEVDPLGPLAVMVGVILILGMFMDQLSMMLITLPFFIPLVQRYDVDLIWFGVILGVNMQTSFMHPPFGFALSTIAAAVPVVTLLVLIAFPVAYYLAFCVEKTKYTWLLIVITPWVVRHEPKENAEIWMQK